MPIFRIMGFNASNNQQQSNRQPNQQGAPHQQQQQQQLQQQQQRPNMYPGQRSNSQRDSFMQYPGAASRMPSAPVEQSSAPTTLPPSAPSLPSTVPSSGNFGSTNETNTRQQAVGGSMPPTFTNASNDTSRPGAYSVTRTSSGPAQVFRVTVPPNVVPGEEFAVHAGSRRVRVRCPPTSSPGQSLQITLPPEPITQSSRLQFASLTSPSSEHPATGGYSKIRPEVERVNQNAVDSGAVAQSYLVTIPPNIFPGMQFTVNLEGQRFMVTCPANAGPNSTVRIVPPAKPEEPLASPKMQVFEVNVPAGVSPGQPFTLTANEQRVLVTCPPNVLPGQKIRFQLPVHQVVSHIKLAYEGNQLWTRTVRVQDLKFQWVRTENEQVVIDDEGKFDFKASAYVRKITYLEGNDARMRTGLVEFAPAQEAVVESKLVVGDNILMTYSDVSQIQRKPLEDKMKWFESLCGKLTSTWEEGHIKIVVRRQSLLYDSVDAIMSLSRADLRKRWRFEFLGEVGIDAGGLAREWFLLISGEIFDPDRGLWLNSSQNQMCMTINPASNISCPDDHLIYFRFLGRVLGRALFDRQLIKGHMVRHIYKHLLGWPISFADIEHEDYEYYQALKKLANMEDVSLMCLDFTVTEETLGVRTEVELVEKGALKEVTNENVHEYLESNLKYRMLERTKTQMTELLLGFFDIIPEPALTVFDPHEIELMLCGLPTIDLEDWMCNTIYSGLYESKRKNHQVVIWFWEIVKDDFDQEMKARLLQFVTGTSGVPARGFSFLQGSDGDIKKFSIHGVSQKEFSFPRAHTCFNRLDLPDYTSRKEMMEKLKIAITSSAIGFGLE